LKKNKIIAGAREKSLGLWAPAVLRPAERRKARDRPGRKKRGRRTLDAGSKKGSVVESTATGDQSSNIDAGVMFKKTGL